MYLSYTKCHYQHTLHSNISRTWWSRWHTRTSWTIWSTWKRWFQWQKKKTTNDTEILYKGKAAGSSHDQYGGGANYICLPDEPEFLSYIPGIAEDQSYIYGAEYQNSGPLSSLHDHNVPCVVCYASTRISI